MIPRSIRLVNFLSYRDCTVPFGGIRLAVLSGKNGDGKSALLDSMTWAVWGKGRGRGDDDRIRLGADHMLVNFEFESAGTCYRVIRKRTRAKGGSLDFFQLTEVGEKSINGATMAETQAEIIKRVRMDFETFENSAFLAQGHADAFTKRTPKERKAVFRKILGLDLYESLSVAASDRRKDVEGQSKSIRAQIEEADGLLAQLPAVQETLAAAGDEIAGCESTIVAMDAEVSELRALAAARLRLVAAMDTERGRERDCLQQRDGEQARLDAARVALDAARAALERGPAVVERYEKLAVLRGDETALAAAMAAARACEERVARARSAIAAEGARLEAEVQSLALQAESRLREAEGLAPARALLAELDAEAEAIAAIRARAEAAAKRASEEAALKSAAEATATECKMQNVDLHRKQQELEASREAGAAAAECPVCRQPLSPANLDEVLADYSTQRRALGERHALATAEAQRAATAAAEAEAECGDLQREAAARDQGLARDRKAASSRLGAAEAAQGALPGLTEKLGAARDALAAGAYATDARAALCLAEQDLAQTGYDAARHAELRDSIAALSGAETEMQALSAARERAENLVPTIGGHEERIQRLAAEAARAAEAAAELERDLESAEDAGPRLEEADTDLAVERSRLADLQRSLGRAQREEEQLLALAARTETARTQATAFNEERCVFEDLEKGFGRDGVQAMLIEQSLPRLEEAANAMLERMTAGRITVQIRTTRETKSRELRDTLDILIQDDAGCRDYEMYSGGEAFRVDFAIRIALARLLAERAGADLPTLIIDEGFGSQDSEGIDRLVDAITSISDEFRLILVVTHVDEMRGRFEQRIEVTKDHERGSQAVVV